MLRLKVLKRVISFFFYSRNKMHFCRLNLSGVDLSVNQIEGLSFRQYSYSDSMLLKKSLRSADFEIDFSIDDVDRGVRKGDLFYLAILKGEIIGHCWWSFGDIDLPNCAGTMSLHGGEAYCHNNYISKIYRGQGILNCLKKQAYSDLLKVGITREWLFYYSWNKAAQRSARKLGYENVYTVSHGYLLSFRYVLVGTECKNITFNYSFFDLWLKLFRKVMVLKSRVFS